jgi:protein-L-isoaspartate(D-aspartate) O-methyltransferase
MSSLPPQGLGLDSESVRLALVQKLRQQAAAFKQDLDERVLQSMAQVPRHLFVDTALANQAYEDTSLPIGWGQTISKPSVVARMLSLLAQAPALIAPSLPPSLLEIGTGCGYQTALLMAMWPGCSLHSLEYLKPLYTKARSNLSQLLNQLGSDRSHRRVHLHQGDGRLGYEAGAPFHGIICAASSLDVPSVWLHQLAVGGRLIMPWARASSSAVAPSFHTGMPVPTNQVLLVTERTSAGYVQHVLDTVQFVPLVNSPRIR